MISKEESRLLLPLLEDHSREEKLKRGMDLYPLERASPEAWLARLLDDPHPWIVADTLHLVRERQMFELRDQVARHLRSVDAVNRETACLTLAHLIREGAQSAPEPADQRDASQAGPDRLRGQGLRGAPSFHRPAGGADPGLGRGASVEQVLPERPLQIAQLEGLGDVVIHSRRQAALLIGAHCSGGQGVIRNGAPSFQELAARIRRVVSRPSSSGICMSIKITS